MRSPLGRAGPEKAAFLAASAWLLVAGTRFVSPPAIPEWGPQMTAVPAAGPAPVSLGSCTSPFRGGRDPFASAEREWRDDVRGTEGDAGGKETRDAGGTGDGSGAGGTGAGGVNTGGTSGGNAANEGDTGGSRRTGDRERSGARFVGTVRVEDSERWIIVSEGERYLGLGGDAAERRGPRLVRESPAILIIETSSGERIRVRVPESRAERPAR